MSAAQLLRELQSHGVKMEANGDRLRYEGPRWVLDRQVLAQVRAHKAELLALLSEADAPNETQRIPTPQPSASTCSTPTPTDEPDAAPSAARAPYQPDPDRLRLAYEINFILQVLAPAKRLKGGDWRIEGELYDHDNALALAGYRCGHTSGGYPLEFAPRSVYEPQAAREYADELHRSGKVTSEQHANLLAYATAADETKSEGT